MRCLTWDGEAARVRDQPRPQASGSALIRVSLAGVCATDLEITRGYMDFRGILGHEFVGRVEEGPESWRGARVVGEINIACGSCDVCFDGLGRHCPKRSVLGILNANGAFAEYLSLPLCNLHRVPDSVPDEAAVFCEPLAAAFEILEQVEDIGPGCDCIVFGDGRLGLLISQVLHMTGARILAVGRHPDKLSILEARGIETQLLADWEASPRKADVAVEATGSPEGFSRAMSATRPRGRLVLKSTIADAPSLNLAPLVIDEISVVGSRCGPFAPALEALEANDIDVASLISARYPLEKGDEALARAGEPGVIKVLIEC